MTCTRSKTSCFRPQNVLVCPKTAFIESKLRKRLIWKVVTLWHKSAAKDRLCRSKSHRFRI